MNAFPNSYIIFKIMHKSVIQSELFKQTSCKGCQYYMILPKSVRSKRAVSYTL